MYVSMLIMSFKLISLQTLLFRDLLMVFVSVFGNIVIVQIFEL